MNDKDMVRTLREGLSRIPSPGFDERVMAAIPQREPVKKRFLWADEPLLLGMVVLAGGALCAALGLHVFGGTGRALSEEALSLITPLVLLPVVAVFIVLFNVVTGKVVGGR